LLPVIFPPIPRGKCCSGRPHRHREFGDRSSN
jgi:hypothetical protein